MGKPILCLDFDGVLHSYTSGWKGADIVPDPPTAGAMEFLVQAVDHFNVQIFSSRSNQEGGIQAMRDWLFHHLHDQTRWAANSTFAAIGWPIEKPPAMVTIDDRALTFNGNWLDYDPALLLKFKPWNMRADVIEGPSEPVAKP